MHVVAVQKDGFAEAQKPIDPGNTCLLLARVVLDGARKVVTK